MNWSHGYNVSTAYTYGFYRELSPDWLNLAVLLNGFRVPDTAAPFRYLELGCGQGFGLCLIAATYPQAEFIGVDFNPEHVAHATELARATGLTNVRFEEADFSSLAERWTLGRFDYVTLHGIYSWVPVDVRQSLLRCLEGATAPGALVYVSYNTLPGWVSAVPLQHMLRQLQVAQSGLPGPQIIQQGIELFDRLLAANAGIGAAQPYLKARLDSIKQQNTAYLVQEYLHESWHPLWFSQASGELADAKLSFVGTATLPENYLPGLLSEELAGIVQEAPNPTMRQERIDLVINQAFRRDIYCRGPRTLPRSMEHISRLQVYAQPALDRALREIGTTFGRLSLAEDAMQAVGDALLQAPRSVAELAQLPPFAGKTLHEPIQVVVLLLHAGQVGLAVPDSVVPRAGAFNDAVARRAVEDYLPYGSLTAARSANGVPADIVQMTLYRLLKADEPLPEQGTPASVQRLASRLMDALLASGRTIRKDGAVLKTPEAQFEHCITLTQDFLKQTLPGWKRLGVIGDPT